MAARQRFDNDRSPVLQNLDGFQNEDALLVPHFHSKAKTLKEAQAGEHAGDDALKFYTEREWPEVRCDRRAIRRFWAASSCAANLATTTLTQLCENLRQPRPPASPTFAATGLKRRAQQIENGKCKRAGLLATQGIRGGANREVLEAHQRNGRHFLCRE